MSLQTLISTLEQRALLTYVAPQFLGNPKLSLQLSALFDHSHNVRTFSSQREEGSIQLGQKLSKANTAAIPLYLSQGQRHWNPAGQPGSDSAALAAGARRIFFDELHPGQAGRSHRFA